MKFSRASLQNMSTLNCFTRLRARLPLRFDIEYKNPTQARRLFVEATKTTTERMNGEHYGQQKKEDEKEKNGQNDIMTEWKDAIYDCKG
ncbi:CLUMA_CG004710, isoform A [Clunio marinus]|uniref:CLUMA_CG004710, isoform A n=1 Tax=Clunio marinus TaxID=568069 RepID=A0A1J1HWW9_9DIPT|nr:CLUMA_CG004710, isoform A [Clunio marinus]